VKESIRSRLTELIERKGIHGTQDGMREPTGRSQFEQEVLARAEAGVNGQHNRKR